MNAITATGTDPFATLNGSNTPRPESSQDMSETFLKLLVTQMQNQDPLNPMDNAQVTSQMAQINTVGGIEKLNATMQGIAARFNQSQALQGAALVGRSVMVEGDLLTVRDGRAQAGFELAGPADQVKVEVLSGSGRVLDTLQLGAQGAGRHGFEWAASTGVADGDALRFRVIASAGASQVPGTPLVGEQVIAVSTSGAQVQLELANGQSVPYEAVQAIS